MTASATDRPVLDWPGLHEAPGAGPRSAIARRLFRAALGRLDVTVHVAAGSSTPAETLGRGGPEVWVHRPDEFYARIARDQLIGFGEAYLTGAWDEGDQPPSALGAFLGTLAAEMPTLVPAPLQALRRLVVTSRPRSDRGTRRNTRANVAHHYDLSNDLFARFLDPTLSYSSALFDGDPALATAADHVAAQHRKIDRLLDQAGVGQGTRLLEIGTGWGELAIRAAARGASVHTITLSSEQLELAEKRIAIAGLSDRVDVELIDYRALLDDDAHRGAYDAIVSVEMIEAVGRAYWPAYFRTLDAVLAPGGRIAIQAITMPHDRMLATRNTHTFITKYIFPGGALPSVRAIEETLARHTSLRIVDDLAIGQHYARTLALWDEAFMAARAEVRQLGFDETFCRMWHFYLEYSRAGFLSGYIDDHQLTFAREDA